MKREYLSPDSEPALGRGRRGEGPAGEGGPPPDERSGDEAFRDTVLAEPGLGDPASLAAGWREWIAWNRARSSPAGDAAGNALLALASGPAAVVGVFLSGVGGGVGILYAVTLGPILEEILKQAGGILLYERLPWRVRSPATVVLMGAVSGLGFATVENLLYGRVYLSALPEPELAAAMALRWGGCTLLHVACSVVASLGLLRAGRERLETGAPLDLSRGYRWFAAAMVLHGAWNAGAILWESL